MESHQEFGEVFGEAPPLKASVGSAQHATFAEIVAIAANIWQRVKSSKVAKDDDAGNERLLSELQAEFKDFNASFPLVLRWIVQMREFNAGVFTKYLKKHAASAYKTRQEFLEMQAEYLVLLYRNKHSHVSEGEVRQYRATINAHLAEEDRVFLETQKQVEAEVKRRDAEDDQDRRRRLYEFLLAQKDGRPAPK